MWNWFKYSYFFYSDLLGVGNSDASTSGNYNKLETSVSVPGVKQPQQQSPFSTLESTEMYYTLDFSDNQNSPLIQ